jgi:hypothetical protein
MIWLCRDECQHYMLTSMNQPIQYWPAMMWTFLSCLPEDSLFVCMEFKERWSYIPADFRQWWIEIYNIFLSRHDMSHSNVVSMLDPEPKFVMGDGDRKKMNEALTEMKWQTFHLVLDSYVSYPTVRCPWGCSEYIHLTNLVPLEEYLAFKSNWCFGSISSNASMWTLGTKPSFPETATVLENPDFPVQPTLITDSQEGLCILCCQNHSKSSIGKYLHVAENPLGSMYSAKSDQYAQVVLQSRTLRKTKHNVYSDTYQTNILMGGYDGLDSCYLTKSGSYGYANNATRLRDYLYISGRSDVRCYVAQLFQDRGCKSYIPKKDVENLLCYSRKHFPDVPLFAKLVLDGSTFITLEDAVNVQEYIYKEGAQVIEIKSSPTVSTGETEFFQPPWPTFFLRVHPVGGFGEQFPKIVNTYKSFVAWSLIAAAACVPSIWSACTKSIKSDIDPIGYLVACAWNTMKAPKSS